MKRIIVLVLIGFVTQLAASDETLFFSAGSEGEAEWQKFIKDDPVLEFAERVNQRAEADPLWKENYMLAHYRAFVYEANDYAVTKFKKQKK